MANTVTGRTVVPKVGEIERKWFVISAAGLPLGRLAARVAAVLRGKHKTCFTPHLDCGDFVIIVDAEKLVLTGNKATQKMHYRQSRRPGSLKAFSYRSLMERDPVFVVRKAVQGMLPHNRLGRQQIRKLRIYTGAEHQHAAQQPQTLTL